MTDWWTPGHNALWIVGLALGLAVLGVAHDEAQAEPDWLPVVARSEPGLVLPGAVIQWPGLVGARGLGATDPRFCCPCGLAVGPQAGHSMSHGAGGDQTRA